MEAKKNTVTFETRRKTPDTGVARGAIRDSRSGRGNVVLTMIDNPLPYYGEVPDPRKAFECEICGADIYVGETYVYEDDEKLCTDCGSEDGEVRIAEEREYERD